MCQCLCVLNIFASSVLFGCAFMSVISLPECVFWSVCLVVCSSPEWDEIDPSEREDLHLKMEDGEFW